MADRRRCTDPCLSRPGRRRRLAVFRAAPAPAGRGEALAVPEDDLKLLLFAVEPGPADALELPSLRPVAAGACLYGEPTTAATIEGAAAAMRL
jgi:hypothetical protein